MRLDRRVGMVGMFVLASALVLPAHAALTCSGMIAASNDWVCVDPDGGQTVEPTLRNDTPTGTSSDRQDSPEGSNNPDVAERQGAGPVGGGLRNDGTVDVAD